MAGRVRMPAWMAARPPIASLTPADLDAIERNTYEAIQPGVVEIRAALDAWVVRAPGPPGAIGYSRAAVLRFASFEDARRRLEELTGEFHAEGRTAAFAVAHGVSRPDDLAAVLRGGGLIEIEREAVLWAADPPAIPHLDPGLRIEQVTEATAENYVEVEAEVFGIPAGMAAARLPSLRASIAIPGRRAYLVAVGGRYVATTRVTVVAGLASLTSVGVLPEERGHGYGRLITAVATRAGLAAGARLVWLAVTPDNTPALRLYESLGYHPAFDRSLWIEPGFRIGGPTQ
jgi:ribosomal protein S18 acetylase RimI-like enzyme